MKRIILGIIGIILIGTGSIPLVRADTVIFNDTFLNTGISAVNLPAHTPDTGTSWTKILSRDTAGDQLVIPSTDVLGPTGGSCGLNEGAGYSADASYSGADYYVEVTMTQGDSSDDYNWIGVRVEGDGDGYWLRFNEDGAQVYEASGGAVTWTTVGAAAGAITNGSVVKFEISGSTITASDDGVSIISTSDGTYTAAGTAGVGMGDLTNNGSDDCSTQQLDNFKVTIVDGGGTGGGAPEEDKDFVFGTMF